VPLGDKALRSAEYLDDAESQAELLADAFDSGDAGYIAHALSSDGDPSLSTLLGVTRALGIRLSATPATVD
jgi:DNA-binding phage protein